MSIRNTPIWLGLLTLFAAIIGCANNPTSTSAPGPIPLGVPLDTAYLHTFTKVNVSINTAWIELARVRTDTTISTVSYQVSFNNVMTTLKWSGFNFTTDTSRSWHSEPQPPDYRGDATDGSESYKLNGTITSVNTITGSCNYSYSNYGRNHWGMVYENGSNDRDISYQSIPAVTKKDDTLVFSYTGSQLKSFVSSFAVGRIYINPDFTKVTTVKEVLWDTIPAPVLTIRFFKQ
jgi:hypothetical protein